jgi:ADP-ribose pyrophosphatase YjhB (NUDIX family)
MTTDRRFARFNSGKSLVTGQQDASPLTTRELPEGGMCLSSFVLLSEVGHPNRVLLGHLNTEARWDQIGALDAERIAVHSRGWMIPSCHLMLRESPHDAARRVLREQLELDGVRLSEPQVVSEVYTPRRFPGLPSHWDLEFIFRGELPHGVIPRATAWRELAMVDTLKTRKSEMARSHEDVLESAGLRFAEDSAPV